jgi:hypothetical protein
MFGLAFLHNLYFAAACNPNTDNPSHPFFGFPHWWQYINTGQTDFLGHCTPVIKFPDGVWAIALAVTSMLLYLAGLVAVFSVIVAGIQYMTASGNPEKAASARKRLYNALIGVAIVFVAAPTVAFLGNRLG